MTESMMATVSPPGSFSIGEGTPTLAIPDDGMSHDQITPLTSLPSLEAEDFWHKTLQPTMWDDRFDQEWGSILTGDDFDLDAVNMSLLHTSDSVPVPEMPVETNIPQTQPSSNGGLLHPSSLQQQWHTFFKPIPLSRQMNSDPSQDSNKIDESYRKRLAEHLQQPVQHGILPSTPFLVCFVFCHLYTLCSVCCYVISPR